MPTMLALTGGWPRIEGDTVVPIVDVASIGPPQACLVLAFLVVERHRRASRAEVAELLWAGERPPSWEPALRGIVKRVRDFLGGQPVPPATLEAGRGWYQLLPTDEVVVDTEHAGAALDLADGALLAGDPGAALAHARRATAIYATPPLPLLDNPWACERRARHREGLARALELESRAQSALGVHAEAVAAATEARRLFPLRESVIRALMSAHRRAGNRAEALVVYDQGRQLIRTSLGVEPSAETQRLFAEILSDDEVAPSSVPACTRRGAEDGELAALRRQLGRASSGPLTRDRARDLLRLGQLSLRQGHPAEADGSCAEVARIARALRDSGLLAETALVRAAYDAEAGGRGEHLVREALIGLGSGPKDEAPGDDRAARLELRTALRARRIQYLAAGGRAGEAASAARELAATMPEDASARLRAWTLTGRLYGAEQAWAVPGSWRRRAADGAELFQICRGTEPELALLGLEHQAAALAVSGDLAAAYDSMTAYARVAASEPAVPPSLRVLQHKAFRAGAEGRFGDCEAAGAELVRLGGGSGADAGLHRRLMIAAYPARWLTGRAPGAGGGCRPHLPSIVESALADRGRSCGLARFNAVGLVADCADVSLAAELYAALGGAADEACVYDGSAFLGSYQLHLGRLALVLGRWERAAGHFAHAVDRHRRAGAAPWLALSAAGLADALEEGRRLPATPRSSALRAEARDIADQLGMLPPATLLPRARPRAVIA